MLSIPRSSSALLKSDGQSLTKTDYWYVMYHEIVDEEHTVSHGKTHISASAELPQLSTLSDLLDYSVKQSNLPYERITIDAVTCLTLFGQRYVGMEEKLRANAVYHVYFRAKTAPIASRGSLEVGSETEGDD